MTLKPAKDPGLCRHRSPDGRHECSIGRNHIPAHQAVEIHRNVIGSWNSWTLFKWDTWGWNECATEYFRNTSAYAPGQPPTIRFNPSKVTSQVKYSPPPKRKRVRVRRDPNTVDVWGTCQRGHDRVIGVNCKKCHALRYRQRQEEIKSRG